MGTSSLQIDSLRNISPLIACRGRHEFDRTLNQELLKALKGDLTGFYLHSETAKTFAPVSTLLTNPNSPGYLIGQLAGEGMAVIVSQGPVLTIDELEQTVPDRGHGVPFAHWATPSARISSSPSARPVGSLPVRTAPQPALE